RVRSFNPAAEDLFGYKAEEVVGRSVDALLAEPPARDRSHPAPQSVPIGTIIGLATGARELLGRRKDGDSFTLELSLGETSFGSERLCVAFTRDVTKRKQAQKYLAAHYAATRTLAEARTTNEAVTGVLRAACSNLGWDVGEFWKADRAAGVLRCVTAQVNPILTAQDLLAVGREVPAGPAGGLPARAGSAREVLWVADL